MAASNFGVITLDGISFMEQPQVFALEVPINTQNQLLTNQRLTLPGVANFLLKGLTREFITQEPFGEPTIRQFRFRMNNTEGATWFFSGGLGLLNDRVFDMLCFGSGQFPFPLIPPIPVHASGSIIYEIEDANSVDPTLGIFTPYTIAMAFHGSYLIPVDE